MPEGFTVNDFDHLEEAKAQSSVSYGIYDTRDNCWIGDDDGPRVFTREESEEKFNGMPQETIAQIAAQMAGVQLGFALGRLRAQAFNDGDFRMRDEMQTLMTPLEALIRLESGSAKL